MLFTVLAQAADAAPEIQISEEGLAAAGAALAGIMVGVIIASIVMFFVIHIPIAKLFAKAGRPGWAAFVPIYNLCVMAEIGGLAMWWGALVLIPVVGFIFALVIWFKFFEAFGKGVGYFLAFIFLPIVNIVLLYMMGFGSSQYQLAGADVDDDEYAVGERGGSRRAAAAGAAGSGGVERIDGEVTDFEEDEDEEPTVGDEINDVMKNMLPWMTSLLFHLGIIVLALFLVWSYIALNEEEEAPIIPSARLSTNPGGQLSESESVDLQASQQNRQVQSESVSQSESLENLATNTDSKLELIGLAGGGGGGGKLAPFGTTTGKGKGLKAGFYGTGGNAHKIIYIVDASGSLIDTLPFAIKELKRSISELVDAQKFTVIFFQDRAAIEAPPRGLKAASSEVKKKVNDWVTLEAGYVTPRGATDPINALKLAMSYRPELVFILSDNITGHGVYEVDRDKLMDMLDKANKDRKIKINAIQFIYPDGLNTLRDIAKEHGGTYRFVTEKDLGLNK